MHVNGIARRLTGGISDIAGVNLHHLRIDEACRRFPDPFDDIGRIRRAIRAKDGPFLGGVTQGDISEEGSPQVDCSPEEQEQEYQADPQFDQALSALFVQWFNHGFNPFGYFCRTQRLLSTSRETVVPLAGPLTVLENKNCMLLVLIGKGMDGDGIRVKDPVFVLPVHSVSGVLPLFRVIDSSAWFLFVVGSHLTVIAVMVAPPPP